MTGEPSRRKRGRPPHPDILTPREWQVLDLLRQDLTNEQIAHSLDISPATAKYHVSEILSKLGVQTRDQAAAWQPPPERWWWERIRAPIAGALRRVSPLTLAKSGGVAAALALLVALLLLALGVMRTEPGDAEPLAAAPCLNRPPGGAQATRELFVATYIDSNVWFVDADGGSTQQLIAGTGSKWSLDGQRLAFLDGTHDGLHFRAALCVANNDGTEVRSVGQVFQGDTVPPCAGGAQYSWSADGRMLAYETDGLMYTISLDAPISSPTELTHGIGPAWSPDGKLVAFSSPALPDYRCAVWVVYLDDRSRHDLLFASGQAPQFSPDGSAIAFVEGGRVMVGDADGGESHVVADLLPEREFFDGPWQLFWSPDGTRIAFSFDEPGNGYAHIYVVDLDRPGEQRVIAEGDNPSWSPDGSKIVYSVREGDDRHGIYIVDADGGEPRRLTDGKGPDWSPDGTRIAFTR